MRFRLWPRVSWMWLTLVALGVGSAAGAAASHAWVAAACLAVGPVLVAARAVFDTVRAVDAVQYALDTAAVEAPEEVGFAPWQEAVERVA